jgi:hypothetical protein
MDIKQAFLDWTQHTVPYGKESNYLKDLLPNYLKKDSFGNYYHVIGDSDTMFIAHLDTVGGDVPVNHVIDGDIIKTDGTSILGADDKAGVIILLYMIEHNVPGYYLFPIGEEVGCIGSGKLSHKLSKESKEETITLSNNKEIKVKLPTNKKLNKIRKVIAFDRMGYSSVITHQLDQRCCSDTFGKSLSNELNKFGFEFDLDDSGVYSDSAEFADIYPECTNLSVGYFAQHTKNEIQDIKFLEELAKACVKVNWSDLPIERDPKSVEYLDNYYNFFGGRGTGKNKSGYEYKNRYIYDDPYDETPTDYFKDMEKDVETDFFIDEEYDDYISNISYINGKIVDINLSKKRLEKELDIIKEYLDENGVEYEDLYWDGLVLLIQDDGLDTKLLRYEIYDYIPELKLENIKGYEETETDEETETV